MLIPGTTTAFFVYFFARDWCNVRQTWCTLRHSCSSWHLDTKSLKNH